MPRKLNDISGKRFGRLTAKNREGKSSKPVFWRCVCDCGSEKVVAYKHLAYGTTVSCGCYRDENRAGWARRHGHSGLGRTPTYVTWEAIKQRCQNPNAVGYESYGGRGIKLCERWRSFPAFLEDMGERPPGSTIDRIDVDGDYVPGNCRWASNREQANNRRNARRLTFEGQTHSVTEWARKYGMSRGVLFHRVFSSGWPMKRALETPVKKPRTRDAAPTTSK